MYTKNTLGFTVLMALYDEQGATGTDHMLAWTPACKREGKGRTSSREEICLPTGFVSGGSTDQPYSVPAAQGQLSTCLWGRTRGRSRDEWTFVVVNSHAKSIWEAHSLLCERFLWELYRKKHHFFCCFCLHQHLKMACAPSVPFTAFHRAIWELYI